jgi:hypothetical protein
MMVENHGSYNTWQLDISQVFGLDDILWVRINTSEVIRAKPPLVSPWNARKKN